MDQHFQHKSTKNATGIMIKTEIYRPVILNFHNFYELAFF